MVQTRGQALTTSGLHISVTWWANFRNAV